MLLSVLLQAQQVKNNQTFVLEVWVRDSITHQPLSASSVAVKGHRHLHATNEEGFIRIDSIKAGEVKLQVANLGYHPVQVVVHVPATDRVEILMCPESYHLHETIIMNQRNVDDPTFSTQHKSIINSEQAENNRGQNISEMLSIINGITLLNSGPNIAKPVIRGLHSNRVLMLNAGIRQEGQNWGAEHGPEIDPFVANRVEVIKGASAVEFGAEAIGGVIRISPRDYRNEKGVGGIFQIQGLSNNMQGAFSLTAEGTHLQNNQLSWRLQGSMRRAGDSHAPDYVISNTGLSDRNISVATAYRIKRFHADFYYSKFYSQMGIFIASHMGNADDLLAALRRSQPLVVNPFTYKMDRPFQQVTHDLVSMKLTWFTTDKSRVVLQQSYQQNMREEYDIDRPFNQAIRNRPAYDLRLYSLNTEIKWEHELMKHVKGKLGISFMQQQNDAAGVAFIIPHFNAHTAGVYLMEKWEHAKWILEAGLRYDMRWLNANSTRRFNELDESRTFSNFNGIISLVRLLPRQWILTTTTSTGWRAPAINELYSNGLHAVNATYEIGDKTLKPEQSLMLDAVIKKEAKTGRIEIGIYSHYITDFIYQRPNRQPTLTIRGAFPTFQFSQTNAWLNGADISAEKVWFKQWQTGIAISYLYANDAKSNEPLIYMPANRLRMHASYLFDNGKRLSQTAVELRGNYVMRQWRYVTGIDYTDPPPAYFLLGLHVRTHIKVCNNNWMLSMDLHNLFNTRYRDYLSRFRYFTDDAGFDLVLRLSIPFTFSTPVNINN